MGSGSLLVFRFRESDKTHRSFQKTFIKKEKSFDFSFLHK
jgi:hypothetical protein